MSARRRSPVAIVDRGGTPRQWRAPVCGGGCVHTSAPGAGRGSPDSHDDARGWRTYARGMLVPLAATWVPTAVGVALAGALIALMAWVHRDPGPDADEPDSDSGGGGWGRRRPRRPPPVGPVSWQDFERQFAAYVENRRTHGEQRCAGVGDDRAPNGGGDATRRG
jgi:hypothetical protein